MKNAAKNRPSIFIARPDVCPRCKRMFKYKKVGRVFKDFFECKMCGHLWISGTPEALIRFL